jgi:RNA polymerase sigma-70 factor (ECF subfamily)
MATFPHDQELLDALHAEYAGPLLDYVRRLLGGDDLHAQEIVEETLRRAGRRAEGDAQPWLFDLARRLVRAAQAGPPASAVADALETLSAEHRRVLLELHFRGRSIAAAAALLDISEDAVRARSYYALRALDLALEERGVTR